MAVHRQKKKQGHLMEFHCFIYLNSPKTLEHDALEPHKEPELISYARLYSRICCANVKPNHEHERKADEREHPADEKHDKHFDAGL
jgi:hypothetical protein